MRTNTGDRIMAAYVAGLLDTWAGAISVGAGSSNASAAQKKLDFEFARVPVDSTTVDYGAGADGKHRVIIKGKLPVELSGYIHEIGVYPLMANPYTGGQSEMLAFATSEEEWYEYDGSEYSLEPSYSTGNTRIGQDSLLLQGGKTYRLVDFSMNLAEYSANDNFVFATYGHTTVPTTIEWRFGVDDANYFTYSAAGSSFVTSSQYRITEFAKSAWTPVGSPDWSMISYMDVIVTGGAFTFDGARVEDMDTLSPDYGIVYRQKLASPVRKIVGRDLEVEFSLDI